MCILQNPIRSALQIAESNNQRGIHPARSDAPFSHLRFSCPTWKFPALYGFKSTINRAALITLMEPVVAARTRADWIEILGQAGVPCAPVNDIAELAASEQLAAVDMLREIPGSGLKVVGLPISFDGVRPYPRADSPKVGQHNGQGFQP